VWPVSNLTAPTIEVVKGNVVTEIRQHYSDWATHVIRLVKGQPWAEVEWTLGPIPLDNPWIPSKTPPPPAPTPGKCTPGVGAGCVCDDSKGGGWKQTANCSAKPQPALNKKCGVVPKGASGYCQCSDGVRVGGVQFNSKWGCGMNMIENCNDLCKSGITNHGHADGMGKEVIWRLSSGMTTKRKFYTDSNAREMVPRVFNKRGPSYPMPYNITEPIAGNYYPLTNMIALEDEAAGTSLNFLIDRAMGGGSITEGSLEVMINRFTKDDDSRGVGQPLQETMCGGRGGGCASDNDEVKGGCSCAGLTVRGKAYIVFDKKDAAHTVRRMLSEKQNWPALLAFGHGKASTVSKSFIAKALPPALRLLTFKNMPKEDGGGVLLRLAHLFEVGETSTTGPITVSLSDTFAAAGAKLISCTQWSLTMNRKIQDMPKDGFLTDRVVQTQGERKARNLLATDEDGALSVTVHPMEIVTFDCKFAQI